MSGHDYHVTRHITTFCKMTDILSSSSTRHPLAEISTHVPVQKLGAGFGLVFMLGLGFMLGIGFGLGRRIRVRFRNILEWNKRGKNFATSLLATETGDVTTIRYNFTMASFKAAVCLHLLSIRVTHSAGSSGNTVCWFT